MGNLKRLRRFGGVPDILQGGMPPGKANWQTVERGPSTVELGPAWTVDGSRPGPRVAPLEFSNPPSLPDALVTRWLTEFSLPTSVFIQGLGTILVDLLPTSDGQFDILVFQAHFSSSVLANNQSVNSWCQEIVKRSQSDSQIEASEVAMPTWLRRRAVIGVVSRWLPVLVNENLVFGEYKSARDEFSKFLESPNTATDELSDSVTASTVFLACLFEDAKSPVVSGPPAGDEWEEFLLDPLCVPARVLLSAYWRRTSTGGVEFACEAAPALFGDEVRKIRQAAESRLVVRFFPDDSEDSFGSFEDEEGTTPGDDEIDEAPTADLAVQDTPLRENSELGSSLPGDGRRWLTATFDSFPRNYPFRDTDFSIVDKLTNESPRRSTRDIERTIDMQSALLDWVKRTCAPSSTESARSPIHAPLPFLPAGFEEVTTLVRLADLDRSVDVGTRARDVVTKFEDLLRTESSATTRGGAMTSSTKLQEFWEGIITLSDEIGSLHVIVKGSRIFGRLEGLSEFGSRPDRKYQLSFLDADGHAVGDPLIFGRRRSSIALTDEIRKAVEVRVTRSQA